MTNYRRYKWICYVLALIMAFTCTSVGVFANPNGEGDQNEAPEVVANEVEAFDEVEGTENDEAETTEVAIAPINVSVVLDEETNTYVVSWDAVEGADKYVIEYGEVSQEVTETSFTLEAYNGEVIKVKAYNGEELVAEGIYSDDSLLAAETGEFAAPEVDQITRNILSDKNQTSLAGDKGTTSKGVAYERVVDKPITVSWTEYPGAETYDIWRLSNDSYGVQSENDYNGTWYEIVKDLPKDTLEYVDNQRTSKYLDEMRDNESKDDILGGKYQYKIVAKNAMGVTLAESAESEVAEVPNFIFTGSFKNLKWHIKAKTRTKLYKSRSGSSAKLTVPKGAKGTIRTRKPYRSKVYITVNGKTYTGWMIRKQIGPSVCSTRPDVMRGSKASANVRSGEITDRDYTEAEKERYINNKFKKKYSCPIIWVSRYTQKINVFKKSGGKYKLVRVCECSTGSYLNYTGSITGTKKVYKKQATKKKKSYYYKYLNYYHLTNSVHGACYTYKGILKKAPSHKTSTLGCVRTWPADAQWIYNNCKGARVHIYY